MEYFVHETFQAPFHTTLKAEGVFVRQNGILFHSYSLHGVVKAAHFLVHSLMLHGTVQLGPALDNMGS